MGTWELWLRPVSSFQLDHPSPCAACALHRPSRHPCDTARASPGFVRHSPAAHAPAPALRLRTDELEGQESARQASPLLASAGAAAAATAAAPPSSRRGASRQQTTGRHGTSSSTSSGGIQASSVVRVALAAAVALLLGSLFSGATRSGTRRPPPGPVRLALLADAHLAGPEYPLNSEAGLLDNASITRTQQRAYRAVAALNEVTPPPHLAVFGGDVVHDGVRHLRTLGLNVTGLRRLYAEPVNGFTIAQALLGQLRPPRLYAWGNHDSLAVCGQPGESASKQLTASIYRHYFDAQPYASRDVGRHWRVIALNSMLGPTWDPTHPRCNTLLSSYGEEQLRWLHGQLGEAEEQGKHALVVAHFPLATAILDEVDTAQPWRDLRTVLTAHGNVRLLLTGHFHRGVDWEGGYPFPVATLPAVRYSPQNWFILDLQPDGSIQWPDRAKNRGGARCSDWWTYQGGPRFAGAVEGRDPGDCGTPAAGQEAAFPPLPPMLNRSSLPSLDEFNPEGSCRAALFGPFLAACAAGASADCCAVVADATRLSSVAPFATCLCQPSFWQAAVQHMQQAHGVDLAATLHQCVDQHGSLIVWRGGPLTWCPAAPAAAPT